MQYEDFSVKKISKHEDDNFKLQVGWSQDFSVNTHKHQLKVNINIFYKLQKVYFLFFYFYNPLQTNICCIV